MDSSKTPSWGGPASGAPENSQQGPRKNNPFVQSGQPKNIIRHQRQSPYQINADRGKNGSPNNFQERRDDAIEKSFLNFSSGNPFNDQGKKFSNENPFHKNISPGNSFQSRSQYHSPNLSSQQQSRFQSSPHQRGFPPRFSPQTSLKNFNTPSRRFETSSSDGYSSSGSHSHHGNSSKKPYFQRNNSLSNPGGSNKIKDYIHPSMLEDPWKNLPATPMFQT